MLACGMKKLKQHTFVFNDGDNGGEALTLTTEFHDNGDGVPEGVYMTQELCLGSYCNSASFHLSGAVLTPELLRELANQLDKERALLMVSSFQK